MTEETEAWNIVKFSFLNGLDFGLVSIKGRHFNKKQDNEKDSSKYVLQD